MATVTPVSTELDDSPLDGVIGNSEAMREVFRLTRMSARSNASVLLLGETGTGKELIAEALHQLGDRAGGPFVRVSCGTFSESQLDSELFGNGHGPLADAACDRSGRFEAAQGGTIFLDEINSTSSKLQAKLIHVLQEREFERAGDNKPIQVDVRVVAASACDLNREVADGHFREDLYWQLNVLPISLPPLRRRDGDIDLLVRHFLQVYSAANHRKIEKIHPDARKALAEYAWPGNVRELQNYIERAVVWSQGEPLGLHLLPTSIVGDSKDAQAAVFRPTDEQSLIREFVSNRLTNAEESAEDLHKQIVEPVEKELLMQIMRSCNNTQTKAAFRLGINRNTLYKKLQEYGLAKSNGKPSGEGQA